MLARFSQLAASVAMCWILCAVAFAQEAVNHASLGGQVFDPSGAAIVGATIEARRTDTNTASSTTTDASGRFRFVYLVPGPYQLAVRADGFTPRTERLTLGVGAAFDVPVSLALSAVTAALTVTADATLLEAARTQASSTISRAELGAVPLNGRNFLDIALLAPGVSPTNVGGGTQLFAETSAVPGVGLSVASQRNLSNNFMVDGLSANDDAAALSGLSLGVDAIAEFQVVTSGGQAELGRALGGHVNVATRSGTNVARGDAYFFGRDDALNGRNALSGTKLPMHQNQFGAGAGGPVVQNRTFYFVNIEERRLEQSGLTTIGAADATVVDRINARLADVGYQGPAVTTGIYRNPVDTTHVLGKLDHYVGGGDQLSVKYSAYRAKSENARGAGGTSAPSASAGLENLDQALAASNVLSMSASTVLELRGQIAHGNLEAQPSDAAGPAVAIAGVATFGRLSTSPTGRVNTLYQVVSNVSHQHGRHAFRTGADLLVNDDTIAFPRAVRGTYSFASLSSFLAGTYNNSGFTQTFGETGVSTLNPNLGIYAQDDWNAGAGLTVSLGVRHDLQWLDTIRTDTNNLSPRLGLVWAPRKTPGTLVRASAGRFFDRVPLRALANALLSAGNTTEPASLRQISVSLSPGQTGAPVFPGILASVVPTSALVNFTTMDRGLENASSDKVSVEVERQLGASSTVAVGYDWLRGRRLIMSINQNVPACAVSGSNNGCRPNPAYANNNQYTAAGRSEYDGLHVSFVQRPTRWGSYRVSYTYSKSMNNLGEAFFSSPIDPFDLSKDWARSDDDQRHRFVASGSLQLPASVQVSGSVQYYSALPYNITTGANTVQGTAGRPTIDGAFIARNSGQGSAFSTASLRASRTFAAGRRARIVGLVEAFNLLNRRNDLARVTVFGTGAYPTSPAASFGSVTVVGDPQSVQLGLRIQY